MGARSSSLPNLGPQQVQGRSPQQQQQGRIAMAASRQLRGDGGGGGGGMLPPPQPRQQQPRKGNGNVMANPFKGVSAKGGGAGGGGGGGGWGESAAVERMQQKPSYNAVSNVAMSTMQVLGGMSDRYEMTSWCVLLSISSLSDLFSLDLDLSASLCLSYLPTYLSICLSPYLSVLELTHPLLSSPPRLSGTTFAPRLCPPMARH